MVPYPALAADAMMLCTILHTDSKMLLKVGTKYYGLFGLGGTLLRQWTALARILA